MQLEFHTLARGRKAKKNNTNIQRSRIFDIQSFKSENFFVLIAAFQSD